MKGRKPWNKGLKMGKDFSIKISKINKEKGIKPPVFKGPHSEESRQAISKSLSGRPAHNKGISHKKETKDKIRLFHLNNPNRKFKETGIEKKMEGLLKVLGVEYQKQVSLCNIAIVDFYIPSKILVIQCDGCFWHGCPEHNKGWKTSRERDEKQDKVLVANGFKVIRFWEHEINAVNFKLSL